MAAMHIFMGEMDGKRGLLASTYAIRVRGNDY